MYDIYLIHLNGTYYTAKVFTVSGGATELYEKEVLVMREFQSNSSYPRFVVKFVGAFHADLRIKTKTSVFEYLPGGTLWSYSRENAFTGDKLRLLLAQLIVAVSDLHEHGFTHCKIGLDTVELAADGFIRLVDLSGAIRLIQDSNKNKTQKSKLSQKKRVEDNNFNRALDIAGIATVYLQLILGDRFDLNVDLDKQIPADDPLVHQVLRGLTQKCATLKCIFFDNVSGLRLFTGINFAGIHARSPQYSIDRELYALENLRYFPLPCTIARISPLISAQDMRTDSIIFETGAALHNYFSHFHNASTDQLIDLYVLYNTVDREYGSRFGSYQLDSERWSEMLTFKSLIAEHCTVLCTPYAYNVNAGIRMVHEIQTMFGVHGSLSVMFTSVIDWHSNYIAFNRLLAALATLKEHTLTLEPSARAQFIIDCLNACGNGRPVMLKVYSLLSALCKNDVVLNLLKGRSQVHATVALYDQIQIGM